MDERYKRFPPGRGAVMIPLSSRANALAGLAMYSAVRPRAALAQRVARVGIRFLGPRILPGAATAWARPMADEVWAALQERWRHTLGVFDTAAVYERGHENRPGVALLLLRDGRPLAFIKVRSTDTGSLANEAEALREVWRARPRTFSVAEPLDDGEYEAWRYLAMAPLPPSLHRVPVDAPIQPILEELRAALASHPRPRDTPPHWQPMHGDFTPWNLRQLRPGVLTLVDWEYAGWGPPGADEVLYRASEAAVTGRDPERSDMHEAIRFWTDRMSAWSVTDDRDGRLVRSVLGALAHMGRNA